MSHLVRNERWGVVDLDPESGRVFVREDWRYNWVAAPTLPQWTPGERQAYHRALDRLIWARWSNRAALRADLLEGANDGSPCRELARQLSQRALSLTFDVRWVTSGAHWTVTVNRADPSSEHKPRAEVDTGPNTINLFDIDVVPQHARRVGDPRRRGHFYVSPHEFGHTLHNRDEYWMTSPHFRDVASIMNIGQGLRPRHLKLVLNTLHKLVPECTFTAIVG